MNYALCGRATLRFTFERIPVALRSAVGAFIGKATGR